MTEVAYFAPYIEETPQERRDRQFREWAKSQGVTDESEIKRILQELNTMTAEDIFGTVAEPTE
jgi:hypothetical protein